MMTAKGLRVGVFNLDARGHVLATIPLINWLDEQGCHVTFYAYDKFKHYFAHSGVNFRTLAHGQHLIFDADAGILEMANRQLEDTEALLAEYLAEIREANFDLVLTDTFCYFGHMISHCLRIPKIVTTTIPVIDIQSIPRQPKFWIKFLQNFRSNYRSWRQYRSKAAYLEKTYSLTTRLTVFGFLPRRYRTHTMIFCPHFFFKQKSKLTEQYHFFIRPDFKHRQDDSETDLTPWKHSSKKIIYASFGTSFKVQKGELQELIDLFAKSDHILVVSKGGLQDVEIAHQYSNVFIYDYVPQLAVLEVADVFVTHGGINGLVEAIWTETPVVCYPQNVDQYHNAEMIEINRLGIYPDKRFASADVLQYCDKLLDDESIRSQLTMRKEEVRKYDAFDEVWNEVMTAKGITGPQ
ncbi:MAG: glycosyltransferase [Saprospiraceae bacterium]|nr:glycosyltransferase [Saprospiraceae bacterium]